MAIAHRGSSDVRAYLLGIADEDVAQAMEAKYFADGGFLARVRDAETALIEEYWRGRLTGYERELFERKYLGNSALRGRAEEVRLGLRARGRTKWVWQLAVVGAAAVLVVGLVFRGMWPGAPVGLGPVTPITSMMLLRLSPGVAKGAGEQTPSAEAGKPLRLELEMPGVKLGGQYGVRLLVVGEDGRRGTVWRSESVSPTASAVSVEVPGQLLRAGDYVVDVTDAEGSTVESYVFREKPL